MRPVRVVVLCGVGPFGGASRSLYEALRAFPPDRAEIRIIAARGTAVPYHRQVARDVVLTRGLTKLDHTKYSHYRGVRWLVVLRELFHLPFTIVAITRARLKWGRADVVHANEITEIIPLLLAKWMFGAAAVVHVRSIQNDDARLLRTRWLQRRLTKSVAAVVAIDENVRATLPADVPVTVIHNSFAVDDGGVGGGGRAATPERTAALTVGFVGNLLRAKGLLDLVEAAALVRAAGKEVRYLIVGGATRKTRGLKHRLLTLTGIAQDVDAELQRVLLERGLEDCFVFTGHTHDVAKAYREMDVLCFPSHLDAPGRPVFEAAFLGVPSIVAVRKPRPDTLQPGETGLAVPGREHQELAQAIAYLHDHPAELRRMGENARALAERNFTPSTNARLLLEVYERVAGVHNAAS